MANMNKYMSYMRQRDSRGRYMEGGRDMTYERRSSNDTAYWDPYGRNGRSTHRDDVGRDRPDYDLRDRMRGEGYYSWDMDDGPMDNVTNMRSYRPSMHEGGDMQRKPMIGFHHQEDDKGACLTREEAEKWVHSMEAADDNSKSGGKWSFDAAKLVAEDHGIPTQGQEMIDFYAALNMVYSDYCKVARDHKVATEDFFADMAMAFLYDRDSVPPSEKIYGYYMCFTNDKK